MTNELANVYTNINKNSINNYPLRKYDDLVLANSDTGIPRTIINAEFYSRLNKITFETIYQNLQSYPYVIDFSDKKLMTKTYTTGPTSSIVVTIDMRSVDKIIYTLDGDIPIDVKRKKTTFIDSNNNRYITTYE